MFLCVFFFFQAEDGIRDLVRSRGLGDVYKRQCHLRAHHVVVVEADLAGLHGPGGGLADAGLIGLGILHYNAAPPIPVLFDNIKVTASPPSGIKDWTMY